MPASLERRLEVHEADAAAQMVVDRPKHLSLVQPFRPGDVNALFDEGREVLEAGRQSADSD